MPTSAENLLAMGLQSVGFNPDAPGSLAQWIYYTPEGEPQSKIPAVVEPVRRDMQDGKYVETRKITILRRDIAEPREKELCVIDDVGYAVENIAEQSGVISVLNIKRARRLRKEQGNATDSYR